MPNAPAAPYLNLARKREGRIVEKPKRWYTFLKPRPGPGTSPKFHSTSTLTLSLAHAAPYQPCANGDRHHCLEAPMTMSVGELVAFTKKELDADAERQAKLHAASNGELPSESQTGATLDLSNKNIDRLAH